MKKIGYIYRYSEEQKKGILVYGANPYIYGLPAFYDNNHNDKPILFSEDNCISEVKTGQLVYFKLNTDLHASQIERASLSNFKRNIVRGIISQFIEDENCISSLSVIRFENLNSIQWDCSKCLMKCEKAGRKLCYDDNECSKYDDNGLPNSIEELYTLFGNRYHDSLSGWYEIDSGYISIDIFDVSYWIDKNIIGSRDFYGRTTKQFINLFENFYLYRCRMLNWHYCKIHELQKISKGWMDLLLNFSDKELSVILGKFPMLQPALPEKYCFKYLENLSDDYNFPSLDICEAYFLYQINNTFKTTKYLYLCDVLNKVQNDKDREQIWEKKSYNISDLNIEVIHKFTNLLECKFHDVVLINLPDKLSIISNYLYDGKEEINRHILNDRKSYLIKLGKYVDAYEDASYLNYEAIENLVSAYDAMSDKDKEVFAYSIRKKANECALQMVEDTSYINDISQMRKVLEYIKDFLDISTYEKIRSSTNLDLSKLNRLDELKMAFSVNLISEVQFLEQYKHLTLNFSLSELTKQIEGISWYTTIPLSVQKYLIYEIFEKFEFNGINTEKSATTYFECIWSMEDLINWLNRQCHGNLDSELVKSIIIEKTATLNEEDRRRLFKDENISSQSHRKQRSTDEVFDDDDGESYDNCNNNDDYSCYEGKPTYERYGGSYAQDVEGYSDDDIDTIFDGDPSAYWNID